MIVSIIGYDGSGKTTVCQLLKDKLSGEGVPSVHVPFFSHPLLRYIIAAFPKEETQKLKNAFFLHKNKKSAIALFWPFLVFLESYFYILFKKNLNYNKVILFDRYAYDYLISFRLAGRQSRFIDLLFTFIPKPDVSVYLDIDSVTACKRKQRGNPEGEGGSVELYKDARILYSEFAQQRNIDIVDNSLPISETVGYIYRRIRKIERAK